MSTERVTLPGGATIFVEPSDAVGLVSLVVALRTGAGRDPEGKSGLGRIAARMLRRGAGALSAEQIDAALDTMGAELAVDAGTTSISFHAQVLSRNIVPFISLMHTMFAEPTFPDEELERLLRESAAEIVEARDSDRTVANKAMQRTLFAGHPYGRNAGGTLESLGRITKADVKAWYSESLSLPNLVVSYAGDITVGRATELTEALLRGLPAHVLAPSAPVALPRHKGRRLVFVDKPARTQTQIVVARLGTSPHDEDHTPLMVANSIFGGTFTSRLVKAIRADRGWSYSPGSRLSVERERHGFYMVSAPGASDAAPCLALELEMLEQLFREGVTTEEVEFVKKYLVRSFAFDIDTPAKRVHQAIDVELLGLPVDYYSAYTKNVSAVTASQVSAAIRNRLVPDDLIVVVVGTAAELLEPIRSAIPNVIQSEVVSYDAE